MRTVMVSVMCEIDDESDDERDDDNDVLIGCLRGEIVGLQYYKGMV